MSLVTVLLYFCEALVVLCLVVMAGYGLQRLLAGPKNPFGFAAAALALAVFAVAYALADPSGYPPVDGQVVTRGEVAVTYTGVAMFGLAMLALLVSGVRSVLR